VAAGNRERAMSALNNLGAAAFERQDYLTTRVYTQQALSMAHEIGAQQHIALFLLNLADCDLHLGDLDAARAGLCEGLTRARRLGALPWMVTAVIAFANLARAESQTERALALWRLAQRQPAWSSENQREMNTTLARWALDPATVAAGLAQGETLGWDETIEVLLR
jgi:tetratricopeptide (TPR) repeat protein